MARFYLILLIVFSIMVSGCLSVQQKPEGQPQISTAQHIAENTVQWEILQHFVLWKGVPYQLGGNSRSGIDCSAYMQRIYQDIFNIKLPRTAKEQRKTGRGITKKALKAGDLVFFMPETYPEHVGIYLGEGNFIHVSSKRGVSKSKLFEGYWSSRFHTVRRPHSIF